MYKNDCREEGLPKKDTEDQLDFRTSLAYSLCLYEKDLSKKRGRPSNEADSMGHMHALKKKRGPTAPIPAFDVRRDQIAHYPAVTDARLRCKFPLCNQLSSVKCDKCNVHLC
nr:unnamed protein product [Callosobruchus analis]